MKLSVQKILMLEEAFKALDSYERVIQDGDKERVVKDYHKFGGRLRMTIAQNTTEVRRVSKDYNETRNGLIRDIGGGGEKLTDPAHLAKFEKELLAVLEVTTEVDLGFIAEDELRLDINQIPVWALTELFSIIESKDPKRSPAKKSAADARKPAA